MRIRYQVLETRFEYVGDELEEVNPDDYPEVVEEGEFDSLVALLRKGAQEYGVCPNGAFEPTAFESSFPIEDRDYFEKGIHKYYSLYFPDLSNRNRHRANNILRRLYRMPPLPYQPTP